MTRDVRGPRRDIRKGANVEGDAAFHQGHITTGGWDGQDLVFANVRTYPRNLGTRVYSPHHMELKLPAGRWIGNFFVEIEWRVPSGGGQDPEDPRTIERAAWSALFDWNAPGLQFSVPITCVQDPSLNTNWYMVYYRPGFLTSSIYGHINDTGYEIVDGGHNRVPYTNPYINMIGTSIWDEGNYGGPHIVRDFYLSFPISPFSGQLQVHAMCAKIPGLPPGPGNDYDDRGVIQPRPYS